MAIEDESKNDAVEVLKRLETVKEITDPKYAAKSASEVKQMMADKMNFSASLSDVEVNSSDSEGSIDGDSV